ncbi:type IV pilus biogenesis protein PilM [Cohnella fermenti]|nr:pilus assembly protein PilM [Cohnella fermenti]
MAIGQRLQRMLRRSCTGIEMTDSSIKWICLEYRRASAPVVQSFAIEPLAEGAIVDGVVMNREAVILAMNSLLGRIPAYSRRVHFALPSPLVLARMLRLPDIREADLRKMIRFEVEHSLQLPFEHPYYDFVKLTGTDGDKPHQPSLKSLFASKRHTEAGHLQIMGAPSAQPEDGMCDVLLVAASRKRIGEYEDIFGRCSLRPASFDIKSFGLLRLLRTDAAYRYDQTVLLADVGPIHADMIIIHQGSVHVSRSVPLAGGARASAASPASFGELCAEFTDEIDRLTKFYLYMLENRGHEVTQVVLTGEHERLEEIGQFLRRELPIASRLLSNPGYSSPAGDFAPKFHAFAAPMGLALKECEA